MPNPVRKVPRILAVDDDADSLQLLKIALSRAGYSVTLAADGGKGWKSLQEDPPDLLLTDVMMPVLDGFELLRRVRADRRLCSLPVILLTAKSSVDDIARGLELGADEYLLKPFRREELLERVRAHIQHAAGAPAPEFAAEASVPDKSARALW
jgi:DNA-binding response OmpR family regulator